MNKTLRSCEHRNFTATDTALKDVNLVGIFVASASTGTLKLADATGTIVNTFSVAAATWYEIPARISGQLTITVGGTLDATAFYAQ